MSARFAVRRLLAAAALLLLGACSSLISRGTPIDAAHAKQIQSITVLMVLPNIDTAQMLDACLNRAGYYDDVSMRALAQRIAADYAANGIEANFIVTRDTRDISLQVGKSARTHTLILRAQRASLQEGDCDHPDLRMNLSLIENSSLRTVWRYDSTITLVDPRNDVADRLALNTLDILAGSGIAKLSHTPAQNVEGRTGLPPLPDLLNGE